MFFHIKSYTYIENNKKSLIKTYNQYHDNGVAIGQIRIKVTTKLGGEVVNGYTELENTFEHQCLTTLWVLQYK